MSSQGFSFPPPPPPPPPTTQQPSAYPSAQPGQHWNGRGSGGRGRGRGHGNRGRGGGGGGGHYTSDKSRPPYTDTSGYNYPATNYGYPAQPQPVSATSYMSTPPPYPPTSPSNFQHPSNPPTTNQPPQPFAQPAGSAAYQPLPGYNTPGSLAHTTPYSTPTLPTFSHNVPPSPRQQSSPPATSLMMGSAMSEAPGPSHPHRNHGPKPRHGNKRDHSSAFSKPQSTVPRTPAPPPVPSFGNPLPSKPPPAADATRKPKKRKRKHNQLGLTPKTEEHESSEEEDDIDEEAKLAQAGPDAAPLQFSYKGQTASLQSASDIAAWIAERKKKFPTQARIEEKKKAAEEAKAVREASRREKQKEREQDKEDKGSARKTGEEKADPALDAAMKAQRKADKIRRNLNREQKRFAKAEAAAEAARLKVEALQKQAQGLGQHDATEPKELLGGDGPTMALEPSPTTDSGVASTSNWDPSRLMEFPRPREGAEATATTLTDAVAELVDGTSDVSSDEPGSSDWTSSSGSGSDLGSGSDMNSDDDDDSAPEEVSSRRQGPERVPPPPREGRKPACRHFARTGHCNRGEKCKFSHEESDRGPKAKPVDKKIEKKVEKKGRKGLLRALLDRQKDDEDRRAMEVISWLGQNGHLALETNSL
ncbi:hypothetical protein N7462_008694 [Penicillium macrosclerotiorum]|uniref:uncharacterized protein n=1 Tax=Penicillium macrosclerotiorum TaxID=303699 RepID=UPI00254826D8|nr:uncharacterized protein N7462_008694 [Penicillium macrosclerotiorum]KAJ5675797.1 hypothetical protein N7462_008694 [Penicillium macrosclerotiorum]